MQFHRSLAFAVTLLFASPLMSQTQLEMSQQAGADLKAADEELNRVYQQILELYKDKPEFLDRLRQAQRAWIVFRDAELQAIYPPTESGDARQSYGSVFPMCWAKAQTNITNDRIKQLRVWLEGKEEGEVCSGSVKLKRTGP